MLRYPPYSAADVAQLLGHSVDWFYRHCDKLVAQGMPTPLLNFGRKKFDRRAVDAWLAGRQEREPANDDRPVSIDEQRAELARAYGGR